MKKTITYCASGECNLRCRYCIVKIPQNQDHVSQFDFAAARTWMDTYYKNANIHIGGGEPLMISGLAGHIQDLIDDGHDVTVFTNTTLLPAHPELYTLPICWQCSHHFEAGVSYEDFLANIAPLPKERVLAVRLFWGRDAEQNRAAAEQIYADAGYEFSWLEFKGGYMGYEYKNDFEKKPNKHLLMIGLHGDVHNCSNPNFGTIGSTQDMTLDTSNFETFKCRKQPGLSGCQACQSADIFQELHKELKGEP
jgi:hypothetical protein